MTYLISVFSVYTKLETVSVTSGSAAQSFPLKRQKALSYELLPTAKGFLIWISFATQPLVNHSVTHKPRITRIIALVWLLSNCYQKTSLNAANPHEDWFFTVFHFIRTLSFPAVSLCNRKILCSRDPLRCRFGKRPFPKRPTEFLPLQPS